MLPRVSIRTVTRHILDYCSSSSTTTTNECLTTKQFLEGIQVERRRIYDVSAVLEAAGLLKRVRKGYKWLGRNGLEETLKQLEFHSKLPLLDYDCFKAYSVMALYILHVKYPRDTVWTVNSLCSKLKTNRRRRIYDLVNVLLILGLLTTVGAVPLLSEKKKLNNYQAFHWTPNGCFRVEPSQTLLPEWLRI